MNSVRITARLDEQSQFDIQFRETLKAQRQKQIWRESGLIASGCALTDLSRHYKDYLGKTIDEKYNIYHGCKF